MQNINLTLCLGRLFGIIKARFRVLRGKIAWRYPSTVKHLFVTCCVFHNLIVERRRDNFVGHYDLDDTDRFGESVGDFEQYSADKSSVIFRTDSLTPQNTYQLISVGNRMERLLGAKEDRDRTRDCTFAILH